MTTVNDIEQRNGVLFSLNSVTLWTDYTIVVDVRPDSNVAQRI